MLLLKRIKLLCVIKNGALLDGYTTIPSLSMELGYYKELVLRPLIIFSLCGELTPGYVPRPPCSVLLVTWWLEDVTFSDPLLTENILYEPPGFPVSSPLERLSYSLLDLLHCQGPKHPLKYPIYFGRLVLVS